MAAPQPNSPTYTIDRSGSSTITNLCTRRVELERLMKEAISENAFNLVYQPQLDTLSGELVGVEALIRWAAPGYGLISPAEFIPIAESNGSILPIGKWVIQKACQDLARLRSCGFKNLHVAINISGIQLLEQDVLGILLAATRRHGLEPENVHCEITETALIENAEQAAAAITGFANAGFEVWMDDFGTGYASLSVLRDFELAGIKIDRCFVQGLTNCDDDFALTSAIVAMAQRLRKTIVAEGVETREQLQVLSQLGCNRVQGYLIGKPDSIDALVRNW